MSKTITYHPYIARHESESFSSRGHSSNDLQHDSCASVSLDRWRWSTQKAHSPAAIVSPPLRIKIRPISLFAEKGSNGMAMLRAPAPANAACRIVIWTSAEVPFVKTLWCVMIKTAFEASKHKTGRTEGFAWRQRRTYALMWRSALISPPGHHENDGKARSTWLSDRNRGLRRPCSPMFQREWALGYQRR